ncbi:ferredoxin--NADP reductase [Flaviaesturariibacter amylovorans]|uniref:Ferredoxin--NADP reductase n=1 Tax=Flaviaesturariibacter amylovorans TaxID=1084520 RepID=A0ABP8G757_9BACT
MAEAPLIPLRVDSIVDEVPGFRSIRFAPGHGIAYKAGQFLTLVRRFGSADLRRSYSITSSPLLGDALSIGVQRIANGTFSRYLHDELRVGDVLPCTGASGLFCLPEDPSAVPRFFFLAAGSGITPVWSLLRTVLYGTPAAAVLVYSTHDPSVSVFREGLKALQAAFPQRFVLHELFSTDPDLSRARLTRDRLLGLLRADGGDLARTLFYTCGPESYLRFCSFLLRERGVPPAHIRREDFIADRTLPARAVPPDTGTYTARLYLYGTRHEVTVRYPDTILNAALRQGIVLPYSCATGRCGACAARCTKGTVWLAHNEVLTPADLAEGLTLTCTGHPVGGDVELYFNNGPTS